MAIETELLEAVASLVGEIDDYGIGSETVSERLDHLREVYRHHYEGARFAKREGGLKITVVYSGVTREEVNSLRSHPKAESSRYGDMIAEIRQACWQRVLGEIPPIYSVLVLTDDEKPGEFGNFEDAKAQAQLLAGHPGNVDCKVAVYKFEGSFEPRKHEWVGS